MSNPAPLERVNFFAGKLLTADDLAQEQTYHLARHRRHNRFCHGWGVVAGLSVSITDDFDTSRTGHVTITVEQVIGARFEALPKNVIGKKSGGG